MSVSRRQFKTLIRVNKDIVRALRKWKRKRTPRSHLEALREVPSKVQTLKKSGLGSLPRLKTFVREKQDRF